jgi:uncharacterized SAM-binding protein YcdF (DUF218 family)
LFLFFLYRKKSAIKANWILYATLFWLITTHTRYVPDLMVYALECRYDKLNITSELEHLPILILGGGSVNDANLTPADKLSDNSLSRTVEGLRIYHAVGEKSKMVFSGYAASGGRTQAELGKDAALSLGIDPESIIVLSAPKTTEEEVLAYKNAFGKSSNKLILVTSDIHMPRAVLLFKKYGLDPIPAPTNSLLRLPSGKIGLGNWWKSHRHNADKFSMAMHEYIGLLWAKIG